MMRLIIAALLLAASPRAFAQGEAEMHGGDQGLAPNDAVGPLTLDDVKANILTVVQSFVDKRTNDKGWFPLRDRETGMLRKLRLVSLDANKTTSDGGFLYSAPAVLSDEASNEKLRAIFTVDFQGAEWTVKKLRLIKPPARAPKQPKSKLSR